MDSLVLNFDELSDSRVTNPFLDLFTGKVVERMQCPDDDIAVSRRDVQQGKRYIEIPELDELIVEFRARLDARDKDARKEFASRREWKKYKTAMFYENFEEAFEAAIMSWLESLRVPRVLLRVEDGLGVTAWLDPAVGYWES